jgi:hypothetical protein
MASVVGLAVFRRVVVGAAQLVRKCAKCESRLHRHFGRRVTCPKYHVSHSNLAKFVAILEYGFYILEYVDTCLFGKIQMS